MQVSTKRKATVIPGSFKTFYKDADAIINTVRQGKIKKGHVISFGNTEGLSREEIAGFLNISKRTISGLNEVEGNTSLDTNAAEKFLLLARLFDKGKDIFGSPDEFKEWLNKTSFAYQLYGKTPIDLLDTVTGINKIYDTLLSIEFGDLS